MHFICQKLRAGNSNRLSPQPWLPFATDRDPEIFKAAVGIETERSLVERTKVYIFDYGWLYLDHDFNCLLALHSTRCRPLWGIVKTLHG
jgi:hypothetical protein